MSLLKCTTLVKKKTIYDKANFAANWAFGIHEAMWSMVSKGTVEEQKESFSWLMSAAYQYGCSELTENHCKTWAYCGSHRFFCNGTQV